jgi:hypothetical protein
MVGDGIYFLLENQWPENFRLEHQPNTNHSPTKLRPNTDRRGLLGWRQKRITMSDRHKKARMKRACSA